MQSAERERVADRSLHGLLDRFFAGSATAMISQLLDSAELSEDEVRQIRREVNKKLRNVS